MKQKLSTTSERQSWLQCEPLSINLGNGLILYTTKQLAEKLDVHERTILKAAKEGKLKCTKFGKHNFITMQALCDFFNDSRIWSIEDSEILFQEAKDKK